MRCEPAKPVSGRKNLASLACCGLCLPLYGRFAPFPSAARPYNGAAAAPLVMLPLAALASALTRLRCAQLNRRAVRQSTRIGGKTMKGQGFFATIALTLLLVGCNTMTTSLTPIPSQTPTEVAPSNIAGTPTPTPMFTDFKVHKWSSTSPNGEWIAQVFVALPTVSDIGKYYTQLKLSKADGTLEWIVVDEWVEDGLGYTIPQPLQWSRDGRYLYFTNKPVPDGCAVFVNGSDLHRVDLSNGDVRELVPSVGSWLSLSPDETMLAYIRYGDRRLVIRDLATGAERETKLDPGRSYEAGHIIWSPDGTALMLTLALQPCSTDGADAISIVRVKTTTLEPTTLIREDQRLFITVEWLTADQVLLRDREGNDWLMDASTGQVTKK